MEPERAEGIVLRLQPVTESSLILTWFTREAGKLKTMAKGARRPKSLFRGKLDLFYRDEIVFLRSRRSDLHLLQDCFVENAHIRLRNSVATLTSAAYTCELVEAATETEDVNAAVFDLLTETLGRLEKQPSAVLLLWFEVQLLTATGWRPVWKAEAPTSKVLRSIAAASAAGAQRVKLTEAQLADARATLWRFWDTEVGRTPRSRSLLAPQVPR
jgi:DNA repair protein RecO (recombination protein O)